MKALGRFTNGSSCPAQETGNGDQHHTTDQGDRDLTHPTCSGQTEEAEQLALDDASQQSDDQISQEAVATPLHHQTREPASHNATDDPVPARWAQVGAAWGDAPPRLYYNRCARANAQSFSKSPSRVHPERSCKVPSAMVSCLSGPKQKQEPPNRRLLLTCPLIVLAAPAVHTSST
jgi:hypothetical protein